MLTKIENFLDDEKIKLLIDLANELPPKKDSDGGMARTIYDDVTWPGGEPFTKKQRSVMRTILFGDESALDKVMKKVTCTEFVNVFTTISSYEKDDFYDWHMDTLTDGAGKAVKIAYTMFLNEPEDYEGGELVVRHEWGETSIKEKAGTAVFYPSSQLHKVNKIESGKRLVVLGLINCMIASPQDRYLMLEMQDSIRCLDEYSSDNEDIDLITRRLNFVVMEMHKRFIKI